MTKLSIILILVSLLTANVYASDIDITNKTINSIKQSFGSVNYQTTNKIRIKIENLNQSPSGKTYVESDVAYIQFMYTGKTSDIEAIGLFVDRNKNPLVAKIIPGKSTAKPLNITVRSKIDNYCHKTNIALVVIKTRKGLLINDKSFYSFISDCSAH